MNLQLLIYIAGKHISSRLKQSVIAALGVTSPSLQVSLDWGEAAQAPRSFAFGKLTPDGFARYVLVQPDNVVITLPAYQARLDIIVAGFLSFVADHIDGVNSMQNIGDMIDPGWAMRLVANILNNLKDVLTNTFLIIFTMIFMLLEVSTVSTKVRAAFGRSAESLAGPRVFLANLGRYLGIKTLISVVTGICAGFLTWSLGLDFPLLWGMLAFLLNYVPTIGSIIAAVPAVLLALVQLGPGAAGATALGFAAINVVFGNILEPRVMGYGVGLSPLIVFIGLVFWGFIFGPVGMLLSVPLTMTLKLGLESDERTRWVAILIGSERDAQHALTSVVTEKS